ncbi:hypothetical protein [Actinoplanes solisilvae]|uniref:hypothetical protein n=1 Tax=Actinoplanes solisilvae TaxID=2486853 RepID=UPI00196A2BBD|nr:hypothetical protein [Actinoplanes solisilvae]
MTVPSYPAPGYPAPAARARPTVVTVAVYLLYAVAAVQALNAVLTFSIAGRITEAVRDAYAGTEVDGFESIVSFTFIGGAVINLLLGAGFVVLGILDGRGKNAARIVTWVIGGLALCCFGVGLGGTALVSSFDTGTTTGAPSDAELQRQLEAAQPSWFEPITTTLSVIALLAILGTVILLALPAANDFFRKPAAGGWDPTAPPYPGVPGYPAPQGGYQGQPGYPGAAGGSYPGQPAPGSPYPPYPGQPSPGPSYPGQPSQYPGQQGQPGQPAPGLPPYPGQETTPPPADPFAPPPTNEPNPPKPPTDPA